MSYSLTTIWHDRIAVSAGDYCGRIQHGADLVPRRPARRAILAHVVPIDPSSADVWVGHPMNLSVDLGRAIPDRWLSRVAVQPELCAWKCTSLE